jgi:Kef-type K+ transport system membrane component KefB
MSWHEALSIGALMNTRGLMELIALNIGYDLGILSPHVFAMMVLMALATTCMAGPLLWLFEVRKRREVFLTHETGIAA